jgi:putative tryptophan/tyrosine transport system substrate-binding protein
LPRAQQTERIRTVGILLGSTDNPEVRRLLGAFMESFKALGWTEGRNVRFDVRWSGGNLENNAVQAQDLVRQQPDVIFAAPSNVVIALQKETRCPIQSHRVLSTTWHARPAISLVSAT